jgi:hypothetical protein
LLGIQKKRLNATSPMLKRRALQLKGENKPAIAKPLKPRKVLVRDSGHGSGRNDLTQTILRPPQGSLSSLEGSAGPGLRTALQRDARRRAPPHAHGIGGTLHCHDDGSESFSEAQPPVDPNAHCLAARDGHDRSGDRLRYVCQETSPRAMISDSIGAAPASNARASIASPSVRALHLVVRAWRFRAAILYRQSMKRGFALTPESWINRSCAALIAFALIVGASVSVHAVGDARKVSVVSFGLFGDQGVFRREASGAAQIVAGRFGGGPIDV